MQLKGRLTRPDPASAEEIERWLIERNLWPTARIAADLLQAQAELRMQRGGLLESTTRAAVTRLERDLELGLLRDRLQAERPADCWCFGIGGHGRAYVPTPDGEGLPTWRVWCSCEDAQQLRADLETKRAELERGRRQQILDRLWGFLP